MYKRISAALLSCFLATSVLAGCAAIPAAAPAAGTAEPAVEVEPAAAEPAPEAAEAAPAEAASEAIADEDVVEITVFLQDGRGCGDKDAEVVKKLNEYTRDKIGVVISDITWGGLGDYGTALGLALASGEPYDVIMSFNNGSTGISSLYSNGQVMDITELLAEYGQPTLEMMSDYIGAFSIGGRIYGVPTYRNYASKGYIIMREDILNELGLMEKAENMTTWSELEEILTEVKEKTELRPFGSAYIQQTIYPSDSMEDVIRFDNLGDNYVVLYSDSDGNVSSLLENADYRAMQDRVRGWYNKDLIYKDLLTSTDTADTFLQNSSIFGYMVHSELGVEAAKEQTTGKDLYCKELHNIMLNTNTPQMCGLCVPSVSDEPEAAVKWIDALYNSPEMMNLLVWGVEGQDYVVEDGMARYPDGVTADTVGFHEFDFLYGNNFLALPWQGTSADMRELALQETQNAPVSPFMGFVADLSEMSNTLASLSATKTEYYNRILYGAYTDEEWDEYVAKLKTSGLDEYLDAFRTQLGEWLEANK